MRCLNNNNSETQPFVTYVSTRKMQLSYLLFLPPKKKQKNSVIIGDSLCFTNNINFK